MEGLFGGGGVGRGCLVVWCGVGLFGGVVWGGAVWWWCGGGGAVW